MIVVDTNVVSEMLKASPTPAVVEWLRSVPMDECFTTTITQAEMLAGAAVLPDGKRRTQLMSSIVGLFEEDFSGRVLPFDSRAAICYSEIVFQRRRFGAPIGPLDAQIAAIARDRNMAIATRNIRDFQYCGIDLIDPWAA
jgi:predicted nucleic acid-binding protein